MKETLSLVISLLALGFSVYQYIIHGRKIEKQQEQLNQFEFEKHQKEVADASRAIIRLSVQKIVSGSRELSVRNIGQYTATNIRLTLTNQYDVFSITPSLENPIDHLDSGCARKYTLHLVEGQSCATFMISWEDGNLNDNQLIQTIDF